MDPRIDMHRERLAQLPIGVHPASIGPGGRLVSAGGAAPGGMLIGDLVPLAGVLEGPAPRSTEPLAVVISGLGRRAWNAVDSPATAQAIAARASAVVLVTDPEHVHLVARLASRLADRGVRCWVSTDAGAVYARPAAAASALGWGFTPS